MYVLWRFFFVRDDSFSVLRDAAVGASGRTEQDREQRDRTAHGWLGKTDPLQPFEAYARPQIVVIFFPGF